MAMVPYRQGYGVLPVSTNSLFDIFDDMMDIPRTALATKAFPIDVEDKGDSYEVKAYLTGVTKDDLDVELNEGRLSISVTVEEKEEDKNVIAAAYRFKLAEVGQAPASVVAGELETGDLG